MGTQGNTSKVDPLREDERLFVRYDSAGRIVSALAMAPDKTTREIAPAIAATLVEPLQVQAVPGSIPESFANGTDPRITEIRGVPR